MIINERGKPGSPPSELLTNKNALNTKAKKITMYKAGQSVTRPRRILSVLFMSSLNEMPTNPRLERDLDALRSEIVRGLNESLAQIVTVQFSVSWFAREAASAEVMTGNTSNSTRSFQCESHSSSNSR